MTGAGKRRVRVRPSRAKPKSKLPIPMWVKGATAEEIWHAITPELLRLNTVTETDIPALWRYCSYLADWIAADADLKANGYKSAVPMTDTSQTMDRLNPAAKFRADAHKSLRDLEDRFGGSPLARFRLIAQSAAHPGAFGDLFARSREGGAVATPPAAAVSTIGVLQPRPTVN